MGGLEKGACRVAATGKASREKEKAARLRACRPLHSLPPSSGPHICNSRANVTTSHLRWGHQVRPRPWVSPPTPGPGRASQPSAACSQPSQLSADVQEVTRGGGEVPITPDPFAADSRSEVKTFSYLQAPSESGHLSSLRPQTRS